MTALAFPRLRPRRRALNDRLTLLKRASRQERLIGIEINTGVKLGDLRRRFNDACPTRDRRGFKAQSMLTGHGGDYRVTRIVSAPEPGYPNALAVYGVRVGPAIERVEALKGRHGKRERFMDARLADDPTRPSALGSEYRLHHYDSREDGCYCTSRLIHYADGSVEEFAVKLGTAT
jgi:hypothetical protein